MNEELYVPSRENEYPPTRSGPPTSGTAIASLIFSVLGIIQVLPIIGSVAGLILGYVARSDIRDSGGRIQGEGMARAGIVLGWVGVGLAVLVACLVVLVLAGVVTIPFAIGLCAWLDNARF
jgi:hypothetical protein